MTIEILSSLAAHNSWANQRIFEACSMVESDKLNEISHGYDSVMGILNHLVQVEHSFFELAHGRNPQSIQIDQLAELMDLCFKIDGAYMDYVNSLTPDMIDSKRFLIPWFGFMISITEGIVQPLTHSHKHRADVSMLLPLLGGKGVEMDFIQWIDKQRGN